MSALHLVVQFEERVGSSRGASYNITYVPLSEKGVIYESPVSLWQQEHPGGSIPESLPFVAEIEYGMRQFRNKEGQVQNVPLVAAFRNARPVVIDVKGVNPVK